MKTFTAEYFTGGIHHKGRFMGRNIKAVKEMILKQFGFATYIYNVLEVI